MNKNNYIGSALLFLTLLASSSLVFCMSSKDEMPFAKFIREEELENKMLEYYVALWEGKLEKNAPKTSIESLCDATNENNLGLLEQKKNI